MTHAVKNTYALIFLFSGIMLLHGGADARTFFVNAAGGNDGNGGISEEAAWKTIPRANAALAGRSIQGGDTLAFRRGSAYTGSLMIAASGKSGRPLVVAAYGTGAPPVIDAVYDYYGVSIRGSHIVIGDLRVANARGAAFHLEDGSSHILLRDCSLLSTIYVDTPTGILFGEGVFSDITAQRMKLGGCKDSGLLLGAGTRINGLTLDDVCADSACFGFHAERAELACLLIQNSTFNHSLNSGIRIDRALISDLELRNIEASHNRVNGVYLNGGLSRVRISGSAIDDNGGHGLNIDTVEAEDIAIEKCRLTGSHNKRNGFALDGRGRNCRITDTTASRNNGDGFNVHGSWKDVLLERCVAEENGNDGRGWDGDGYTFHDDSTGRMVRCIARDNKKSAIAHVNQSSVEMDRCIFTHKTNGTIPMAYLQGKRFSLTNSVVYSGAQTGIGIQCIDGEILIRNTAVQGFATGFENRKAALTQDHNLVFGAKSAAWAGFAPGEGSLTSDPLFTDPAGMDFTVRPSSPCIDAGVETGSREDFAGKPSPRGKAPDIGAFETGER